MSSRNWRDLLSKAARVIYTTMFMACCMITTLWADVGNAFADEGSSKGSSAKYGIGAIVLIVIAVVVVAILKYQKKNVDEDGNSKKLDLEGMKSALKDNKTINQLLNGDFQGAIQSLAGTAAVIDVEAQMKESDPAFNLEEFKATASNNWLKVQEAWESRDWTTIRPIESNDLFERHNQQLKEFIDKDWYPHLDEQSVNEVEVVDRNLTDSYESLTVKLSASLIDYTTDAGDNIVRGSQSERRFRDYKLVFIRTAGMTTEIAGGQATTNCPNCSAPTAVTSSGQCEYCKSVITNGDYGWALNFYGAF